MHRISVITPSFKQLPWLKLCAASVADQAGVEVEHIIQDAGTGPELEQWAAGQPRIKLHVERDNGMYDAINRGLKRATGEICAYLNCDEQYLPGTLRMVADYFATHPEVEVLFGDAILLDGSGEPLSYRRMVAPTALHTRLVHLGTLSAATFFRRSIVEKGYLFDPQWIAIGDAVWVHRLITEGIRMAVLQEPLSVFTFTGVNLGAQGKSQNEGEAWRNGCQPWVRLLRGAVIAQHRLKKLLAGAYSPKSLIVRHYTPDSPKHRKAFSIRGIRFSWPGPDQKVSEPVFANEPKPCGEQGGVAGAPPTKVSPKIAAVFSTFNRANDAITCVSRLAEQEPPLHRIVIADNASTDGTAALLKEQFGKTLPLEVLTMRENLGNPGGLQLAIRQALQSGAEWVWILDDDSWPRPDTLKKLIQYGLNDQTVMSSLVIDPSRNDLAWPCMVLRSTRPQIALSMGDLPKEEVFEVRGSWLGALIPASIIREVGELDADLFIRGEDEEYPARIRQNGFRFLCVAGSILTHPSPNRLLRISLGDKNYFYEPRLPLWKSYYAIRNQIHVRKIYTRTALGRAFKGVTTLILALLFCLAVDDKKWARFKIQLKAGYDGMTGRLGKRVPPSAG